jgi:hypothetical protein
MKQRERERERETGGWGDLITRPSASTLLDVEAPGELPSPANPDAMVTVPIGQAVTGEIQLGRFHDEKSFYFIHPST